MSGGHGHSEHGHAGHGHGAAVAEAHHGPAEIPPAPAQRSISPAPEDFLNLPGPAALVWPFVWIGLALLLIVSLLASGWRPWSGHEEGAGHGAAEHAPEAPGGGGHGEAPGGGEHR